MNREPVDESSDPKRDISSNNQPEDNSGKVFPVKSKEKSKDIIPSPEETEEEKLEKEEKKQRNNRIYNTLYLLIGGWGAYEFISELSDALKNPYTDWSFNGPTVVLLGIYLIFAGVCLGYSLPYWIKKIIAYFKKYGKPVEDTPNNPEDSSDSDKK